MATLLRPADRPFLTRALAYAVGLLPTGLRRRRLRSAAAAQNVEVNERTRVMRHPTLRTSDTVVVLWWTR